MSDSNRTIVITGASSGIGLGVAQAYVERGANVVLNGRNAEKLALAAKELGHEQAVAVVPGDIGFRATGQALVDAALERFGRLDVLVNNAGHFFAKSFREYTEEDLDGFLGTHLKGMYLTTQAAIEPMRRQGGGAIVNITTVLVQQAVTAIPASAPVAAKGGIDALTRSLAVELAPENIRVNSVAPGLIKTPIHGRTEQEFEELNGMQPLGRLGEVQDVVDAVLYLAEANFVTGVVLPVDGGAAAGS